MFIEGDDFKLRISQEPGLKVLTIEIMSLNGLEMTPDKVTKQLDFNRDPNYQILRLRAKELKPLWKKIKRARNSSARSLIG